MDINISGNKFILVNKKLCKSIYSLLPVYENSISLSSRDNSILTLVLSHSLNSLQKFLTFGHDKNKWCIFSGCSLQ